MQCPPPFPVRLSSMRNRCLWGEGGPAWASDGGESGTPPGRSATEQKQGVPRPTAIVALLRMTSPIPVVEYRFITEELPCFPELLPHQKRALRQNAYNRAFYGPGVPTVEDSVWNLLLFQVEEPFRFFFCLKSDDFRHSDDLSDP